MKSAGVLPGSSLIHVGRLRVLFVEDSPVDVELCKRVLEQAGYELRCECVDRAPEFLRKLQSQDYDLILCDYKLPGWSGADVLRMVREAGQEIPVVVVTGTLGEETAVEMIQAGAADFVLKERLTRLPSAVERALREKAMRQDRQRAEREREALVADLRERIKEATCLYSVSDIVQNCGAPEAMFPPVVARIPAGWQYPQIARVRLRFEGQEYRSPGFAESPWSLAAEIVAAGRPCGTLEVFYAELRPPRHQGPFLQEECDLLHAIAQILGRAVEHHRAEEALRKSERDYRDLFESANDAILIFEPETEEILEANRKALQTYGLAREQLIGRSLKTLTKDVARGQEQLRKLLRDGSYLNFETTHFDHAGRTVHFLCSSTVIDYQGNRAVLSIQRDVTERKQAEQRLELFAHIFDSATDAISIIGPRGFYTETNAAHEELSGYSQAELRQSTPEILLGKEQPQKMLQEISASGRYHGELRLRTKSGKEKTIEMSAFAMRNPAGGLACHVGIARDISERKRLEEQLRQAQKMEAVGRLAGGVAHDFNNLLNIIIGYSDLLLQRGEPSEFLRKSIHEIRKAGDRAAGLTRRLLAFSRQQVLEPRVLDLNEVIGEIKELLCRLIGEDVELVVYPGEGLGRVRADPGQIGQVIMNLAANARDAMPHGGRLTIETANVQLDAAYAAQHAADVPPEPHVLMAVSDNGCGMDAETRSHIFEPFFSTKEKSKGTGLGLATVYGIVKQSGGYVWVYSEPGQGTTFKIYLPRVDSSVERLEAAPKAAADARGSESILVVEDEDGVRSLVHDCLQMSGYNVLEARNGDEALRLAGNLDAGIHLMVTDVVMPGMNGRDLAEQIRRLRPAMKVLYISGYAENAVFRHGVLEPGVPYLQKPFGPSELGRKVREILDQAQRRDGGEG